jgi:hypothetical protein
MDFYDGRMMVKFGNSVVPLSKNAQGGAVHFFRGTFSGYKWRLVRRMNKIFYPSLELNTSLTTNAGISCYIFIIPCFNTCSISSRLEGKPAKYLGTLFKVASMVFTANDKSSLGFA